MPPRIYTPELQVTICHLQVACTETYGVKGGLSRHDVMLVDNIY